MTPRFYTNGFDQFGHGQILDREQNCAPITWPLGRGSQELAVLLNRIYVEGIEKGRQSISAPDGVSIDEMIGCVQREAAMRRKVYPKWVAQGTMPSHKAEAEIRRMDALLKLLLALNGGKDSKQPELSL